MPSRAAANFNLWLTAFALPGLDMAKRTPEQDLIDDFVHRLRAHQDSAIRIESLLNSDCRSKKLADIEFVSVQKLHWVIEAKSDDSKDKHNTVHKIFGELLKETGRTNRADCRHAILIPEGAVPFYSRAFRSIAREKFVSFGKLIPIDTVFTCGTSGIARLTWVGLYDSHPPALQRTALKSQPRRNGLNTSVHSLVKARAESP